MLIYSILLFNLLKPLNINIILLDFNYLWIFSFFLTTNRSISIILLVQVALMFINFQCGSPLKYL